MKLISINNRDKIRRGVGRNHSSRRGNNGQNARSGGYQLKLGIQKRWLQFPKYGIKKKEVKHNVATLNIVENYIRNTPDIKSINLSNCWSNSKPIKILPVVTRFLKNKNIEYEDK